jgi:signal transduction histidine kinase
VVRGRAEYIHKKIGAESPHAAGLSVIVEQIDRVSRTLRQLLDFSRLRPGVVQPVEAEGAFQAVRELLQLEFERRELTLDIAVPAGLPPFSADPDQLQQVIINLVFNACDASSPGGHVKLTAFHEQTGGAWGTTCFSVEDFGAGIAPEHLTQIFDPFFTTKKRGQGTGLGLTIVDQIVRNHSGRIEVASQVGRGTRLTVHWPSAARSQG